MYPLSAVARTFNRKTTTIPKPITHSFLTNLTNPSNPTNSSNSSILNIHLSKFANNDNDIEHYEHDVLGFTKISSSNNRHIYDDKYIEPYLL